MATTKLVDAGQAIISRRMYGSPPTQPEPLYVAWGTGVSTTTEADTTLLSESAETRVVGAGTSITTTNTDDTHQVVATITSSGTQTITEAAVFDAVSSGNMYVKGDFNGVPLNVGEAMQLTFQIQFTSL